LFEETVAQTRKALKKVSCIADPGAAKILLLTRSYPVMASIPMVCVYYVEWGFAEEQNKNSATYRLAQDAIMGNSPETTTC
jgi:hypothetical protein